MLICLSALLVGFGLSGAYAYWRGSNTESIPPHKALAQVITRSTDTPDEAPVNSNATYEVARDMPRKINLPSIGASGFIQQMGIDQHTAVAVPSSIHFAGWYNGSVKPGEAGVSLIDGHVSGTYQPGIFKDLKKLRANDLFTIEYGDHSLRNFQVIAVASYDSGEAATRMLAAASGVSHQLNLITCGGTFDKATNQYEKRVIVSSRLVP